MNEINQWLIGLAAIIATVAGSIIGVLQAWHGYDRIRAARNGGLPENRQTIAQEKSAAAAAITATEASRTANAAVQAANATSLSAREQTRGVELGERQAGVQERLTKAMETMSVGLLGHIERIATRETEVVKKAIEEDGEKTRDEGDVHWKDDEQRKIYERGAADERARIEKESSKRR